MTLPAAAAVAAAEFIPSSAQSSSLAHRKARNSTGLNVKSLFVWWLVRVPAVCVLVGVSIGTHVAYVYLFCSPPRQNRTKATPVSGTPRAARPFKKAPCKDVVLHASRSAGVEGGGGMGGGRCSLGRKFRGPHFFFFCCCRFGSCFGFRRQGQRNRH